MMSEFKLDTMEENRYEFKCNDCGTKAVIYATTVERARKTFRDAGGCMTAERDEHYCVYCARKHQSNRYKNKKPITTIQWQNA